MAFQNFCCTKNLQIITTTISDKNIVPFAFFSYQKWINISFEITFWHNKWIFFLVLTTKNTNVDTILFFNFLKFYQFLSLILKRNFISLKSTSFAKSLSRFLILADLWSAGWKYLTKHHLKHSLSLRFAILIKTFFGWSNSLSNLM